MLPPTGTVSYTISFVRLDASRYDFVLEEYKLLMDCEASGFSRTIFLKRVKHIDVSPVHHGI